MFFLHAEDYGNINQSGVSWICFLEKQMCSLISNPYHLYLFLQRSPNQRQICISPLQCADVRECIFLNVDHVGPGCSKLSRTNNVERTALYSIGAIGKHGVQTKVSIIRLLYSLCCPSRAVSGANMPNTRPDMPSQFSGEKRESISVVPQSCSNPIRTYRTRDANNRYMIHVAKQERQNYRQESRLLGSSHLSHWRLSIGCFEPLTSEKSMLEGRFHDFISWSQNAQRSDNGWGNCGFTLFEEYVDMASRIQEEKCQMNLGTICTI